MMPFSKSTRPAHCVVCAFGLALALGAWNVPAQGQEGQVSQPVYSDAQQQQQPVVGAAAPVAVAAPAAQAPAMPFDFTQQPGEHPLMPFIRVSEESLRILDQSVRDYSCTFVKQERLDGELGDRQQMFLKVLHQPFSVYMLFLAPADLAGREVAYVQGQNNNELVVLDAGWKRRMLGKMHLDPQGMVAMRGQKYPITKVGIRNLTAEFIQIAKNETQFGECEVSTLANQQVAGRPTTLVQILHPLPRKEFHAHITRVFFDNELKIPIHYDSFLWPETGQPPPLNVSYTYANLKVNNGFNALDFDSDNNPQIFQANGPPALNPAGGGLGAVNQIGAGATQAR